jgi:hypothetical protein
MAASGIPVLTNKGRDAVAGKVSCTTARCRSILVQVDGKRSLDDIRSMLRGLDGLENSITTLIQDDFISISRDCKDVVKGIAEKILGAKSPTITRKIDEMHAKYGEACWDHLDELDKAARLFYGEILATNLRHEIESMLAERKK